MIIKYIIFLFIISGLASFTACGQSNSPKVEQASEDLKDNILDYAQTDTMTLKSRLLKGSEVMRRVVSNPDVFKLQIILTQIDNPLSAAPTLKHYSFHLRPEEYFNPASTVKLPSAALALEKLDQLRPNGVTEETPMLMEGNGTSCRPSRRELLPGSKEVLNLRNLILAALVVSEDEAYNALFEFNGRGFLNHRLNAMGYAHSRILQKFQPSCGQEQNLWSSEVHFQDKNGKEFYVLNRQQDSFNWGWPEMQHTKVGTAWRGASGETGPAREFRGSNVLPLLELHRMMTVLFHPTIVPKDQRFLLSPVSDSLLKAALRMKPSQTGIQKYLSKPYHEAITCYFFCGQNPALREPDSLEVYNIVGQAYGFLTESAYILNKKDQKAWVLSATIYVNQDGILNDGVYEYAKIGFPFLKELSQSLP